MERAFCLWGVSCRMQIEQFAILSKRLEPMREAFRNVEAGAIALTQDLPMPLKEGRRSPSDVHGHVEDLSS
jgi:hypothetical protein